MPFRTNKVSDRASNEELINLLRDFAAAGAAQRVPIGAQQQFYNSLSRELEQHAMRVVNYNEEIASVAVQEAWIKIFRNADKYDPAKSSVKSWVKIITTQCAIDQLRAYYKHHKQTTFSNNDGHEAAEHSELTPIDEFGDLVCPMPHSDDLVYETQLKQAIRDCMNQLPTGNGPNFRQAMELCMDEELSYADMTEILSAQSPQHAKINVEQVRGWIRQAKVRIQSCLIQKLRWERKEAKI